MLFALRWWCSFGNEFFLLRCFTGHRGHYLGSRKPFFEKGRGVESSFKRSEGSMGCKRAGKRSEKGQRCTNLLCLEFFKGKLTIFPALMWKSDRLFTLFCPKEQNVKNRRAERTSKAKSIEFSQIQCKNKVQDNQTFSLNPQKPKI